MPTSPEAFKWFVALVLGCVVGALGNRVIAHPTSKLELELDGQGGKAVVKVSGGEASMQLPEILEGFFSRDANLTKATISAWGGGRGIIDAKDQDALTRFGLVETGKFWPVFNAVKTHCTPDNCTARTATVLKKFGDYAASIRRVEKRPVVMTWAPSKDVEGNAIYFPQGQEWFAERVGEDCEIVVGDARFPVVIHRAIRLGDEHRIQVSEGTFVRIMATANRIKRIPALNSPGWRAITDKGRVEAQVQC
jgi:hypothetical protein